MNCAWLCMGCMNEKDVSQPQCGYCGYNEGTPSTFPHQLPPGTILNNRYLLGKVLGHGGFGITYIAWDLKQLRKAAIKEYFPQNVATRNAGEQQVTAYSNEEIKEYYSYGLARFLDEARVLSRLLSHHGIVSFEDFFAANGTAYLVMEYLEGQTMKEFLKKGNRRLSLAETLTIMGPVMDALSEIHRLGLMHRDVSPDNIFITNQGEVKLLDFGAARYAVGEHSRSLSIILKAGYAPEEQYRSRGKQGPWTDIYATSATIYRALTGVIPPEALDRLDDDILAPPSMLIADFPTKSEKVLLKGLAIKSNNRYANMAEFHRDLKNSFGPPKSQVAASKTRPENEAAAPVVDSRPESVRSSVSPFPDKDLSNPFDFLPPSGARKIPGTLHPLPSAGRTHSGMRSWSAPRLRQGIAILIVLGITLTSGVYYAHKFFYSPGAAELTSQSQVTVPRNKDPESQPANNAEAVTPQPAATPAEQPAASPTPAPSYQDSAPAASNEGTTSQPASVASTDSSNDNTMPRPNVNSDTGVADNVNGMPRPSYSDGNTAAANNSMPRPNIQ